MMTKRAIPLLLAAVLLSPVVQAEDDYDKALHVYGCADYPKAFSLFKPLAEQGMALAQYQIGLMTEQGQGADPDVKQAFPWYMKAAQQGVADAYFALGQIYSRGEAVPKDKVQAYAWFALAHRGGNAVAGDWLRDEAKGMTAEQIAQGEKRAEAWKSTGK